MKKQLGMSISGFILFLIIFGILALFAAKIAPAYTEYYSVVSSVKAVAQDPEARGKSTSEVYSMLSKRFQISYVEHVPKEAVKVIREKGKTNLVVEYEVRNPLFYNLDYVAKFKIEQIIPEGGAGDSVD